MPTSSHRSAKKTKELARKLFALVLLFSVGMLLFFLGSAIHPDEKTSYEVLPGTQILQVNVGHPRESVVPAILLSTGGVLFGLALSMIITEIFSPDHMGSLFGVLNDLLTMPWKSAEDDLDAFRQVFHGYLLSQNSDQTWGWRYRQFDFSTTMSPGYLQAVVQYRSSDGREIRYKYNGLVVKNRLFLVGFNDIFPNEPAVFQIFPDCGPEEIHAGYAFLVTPSGLPVVTRTLLSTRPLLKGIAAPAWISNPSDAAELHKIWRGAFRSHQIGSHRVLMESDLDAISTTSGVSG
jgi:hypothetical protein